MISNITYRLSCFSDYSLLAYNKKDVIAILEKFDELDLAPTIAQEIQQDGTVSQRMQFLANGGSVFIAIHSDRIDIQLTSNDKAGFSCDKAEQVKNDLCKYMSRLFEVYSDRISDSYRIAWFTSYIYFEIDKKQKEVYRNKFIKELPFFMENRLDEFLARYGARRSVDIGGNLENLNIIATIQQYATNMGPDKVVDGFKIDYDINTWQFDKRNRFSPKAFEPFSDAALKLQKELDKEVLPE